MAAIAGLSVLESAPSSSLGPAVIATSGSSVALLYTSLSICFFLVQSKLGRFGGSFFRRTRNDEEGEID